MNKLLNTAPEIISWLDSMEIKNYTLIPSAQYGFVVDVEGNVFLNQKNLTSIPVKFNHVKGIFGCMRNRLVSLLGCPEIVEIAFGCSDNSLTSLQYAPRVINGFFHCDQNFLTSLKFGPEIVGSTYRCSNNKLTSLKGCPAIIHDSFDCSHNQLTSLRHAPKIVEKDFQCSQNFLTTLEFCPEIVKTFRCSDNQIENLEFCPQTVKSNICVFQNNPALKSMQETDDFKEILRIQEEFVIQKEKANLSSHIINHLQPSKTIKI